ncbi:hypothetical protein Tco_0963198 [Tanacetum coccineum]
MEKDSKIIKCKKEKYKSLALRAKKESSDDDSSTSGSKHEEYAMEVRDFKNYFKMRGSGSWSDSCKEDKELKKDEICLMVHESNEVHSESSYYSDDNFSIDDDTLQNEYNKLCELSLKVINRNKFLKTKNKFLENEIYELEDKIKRLDRNKAIDVGCNSCQELRLENEKLKETQTILIKLASKITKFKKSAHCLKQVLSVQKSPKDEMGLEFINCKTSTKETNQVTFIKETIPTLPDADGSYRYLDTDLSVLRRDMSTFGHTVSIQTLSTSSRMEFVIVGWNYNPQNPYQAAKFAPWGSYPPFPYMNQVNGMFNANRLMRYWGLNV